MEANAGDIPWQQWRQERRLQAQLQCAQGTTSAPWTPAATLAPQSTGSPLHTDPTCRISPLQPPYGLRPKPTKHNSSATSTSNEKLNLGKFECGTAQPEHASDVDGHLQPASAMSAAFADQSWMGGEQICKRRKIHDVATSSQQLNLMPQDEAARAEAFSADLPTLQKRSRANKLVTSNLQFLY